MDIYQLRYFLAVEETRNFSRAAERAFVSQPTLSAGIKKLELDLGVQLFNRGRRNITLTEAGQRFLPRARAVIHECNAAKQEVRGNTPARRIQVGILRVLPMAQIAALLADFRKRHPDVHLALKEGTTEQLESWLEDRRIDLAIGIRPTNNSRHHYDRLFVTRLVLAAGHQHPITDRGVVILPMLNRLDFIHRSHCLLETETTRTFAREGIKPQIIFRNDEDDKALAMVRAGLGLCMIPDFLSAEGVVQINVQGLHLTEAIGLSWRDDKTNDLQRSFRLLAASHKWSSPRETTQKLDWVR
jgi:DNA-binding transcriptional LysR family regulator